MPSRNMQIDNVVKLKGAERVLRVTRQDPLVYVLRFFLALAFVILPFFFMLPLFRLGLIGVIIYGASILFGLVYAGRLAFVWYWNAGIVTSERVVDIDQRGFFDRAVSEAPYDKIQDVSYKIKGVFGTVFNIGAVIIQTAGASSTIELLDVGDPKDVHHAITEAMSQVGQVAKRTDLVGAAADMSGPEAKAFLTALKGAASEDDVPKGLVGPKGV